MELENRTKMDQFQTMDRSELTATVDELSENERSYLSIYLKMKERMSDNSYAREMNARLKAMQSGHKVQRDEVLDLHKRLSENGL